MRVEVVADSINKAIRLSTVLIDLPTVLLPDLLSIREVSVTRRRHATPISALLSVEAEQFTPHLSTSPFVEKTTIDYWREAGSDALCVARKLTRTLGVYDQRLVERIVSPFSYTEVVASSTSWETVLDQLLAAKDLDLQDLATSIKLQLTISKPRKLEPGEWHLPFITDEDVDASIWHVVNDNDVQIILTDLLQTHCEHLLLKISVARCVQKSIGGRRNHVVERVKNDLVLFSSPDGSPLTNRPDAYDHQATPDVTDGEQWRLGHLHGNFVGWCQHRQIAKIDAWRQHPVPLGIRDIKNA